MANKLKVFAIVFVFIFLVFLGLSFAKLNFRIEPSKGGICSQEVKSYGSCKMMLKGYQFDQQTGSCVEVSVYGCNLYTPFKSLKKCESTCSK